MKIHGEEWTRSCLCAQVTPAQVGESITLLGWVQRTRNIGSIIFIWLRDHSGIVQVVFDQARSSAECFALGEKLRGEYVIAVRGTVAQRAADAVNEKLPTGHIEVIVTQAALINAAETPPIYIEDDANESEAVRLQYRYLDLRRPVLQRTLRLRHRVTSAIRRHFDDAGFPEIETPILTKSTPEGARDFLVPSRLHPGEFYALPQSPQIYKQMLMVAGFDRYYQLARCFRDEDSRADRQPEFTQLDMEMSFVEPEDVQTVIEGAMKAVFDSVEIPLELPLPRITWKYAMENYGSDKPDTRFECRLVDCSQAVADCEFPVFRDAIAKGGSVRAINGKGCASFSRKDMDALGEYVKGYNAKGLAWAALPKDGGDVRSPIRKFFSDAGWARLMETVSAQPGDAVFLVADRDAVVFQALGALRVELARRCGWIDPNRYDLFWVTEFPLFEYDAESGTYAAMHHPFTSWMPEDEHNLDTDPSKVRARAYDLVLNGVEMGSGSIRIHESAVQARMFEMLGLSPEEVAAKFGFMIEAFQYGTPPHGGFAFGIDRLVMMLAQKESLRDVLAFPKNQNALCMMMGTPSDVAPDQLDALHLAIKE